MQRTSEFKERQSVYNSSRSLPERHSHLGEEGRLGQCRTMGWETETSDNINMYSLLLGTT